MEIGFGELFVILLIVFVLFGAGKLPKVMGDLGKGLRAFKEAAQKDEDAPVAAARPVLPVTAVEATPPETIRTEGLRSEPVGEVRPDDRAAR